MLKSFFKDSFIYGGANLLSKSVVILLLPIYARVFPPQELGVLEMIFAFGTIVSVIVPLGISNGIARHLPDAPDDASRTLHASSALWFTASAYLTFAVGAIVLSGHLSSGLLDSERWSDVLRVAVIAIACNGLQYYLQGLLRWRLRPKEFVVSNFFSMITMATVTVSFLLVARTGLVGVYYGQIAGATVGSAIALYCSRDIIGFRFGRPVLTKMLIFSLPMVPALVGEFVANYIDRIAIKNLMSIDDVGIYGMGYRFASVVSLLMAGFSNAITPLIYAHYRDEGTPAEMARIFRFFLVCAIPMVCALLLFSHELLRIFATPRYYEAWTVIPIMGAAFLLFGMYNFAPGLSIAMKTRTIAAIHLLTAGINTALNYVFIPRLGIVGAATATLTSAAITFAIYMILSQRLYPVPHDWTRAFVATAGCVVVALGGLSVVPTDVQFWVGVIIKAVILVACGAMALALLLRTDEMRRLLSRSRRGSMQEAGSGF